jgi:Carboxypeptidase regulatory-like domain
MPMPVRQDRVGRWLAMLVLALPAPAGARQVVGPPGQAPVPEKPGTAFILGRVVDAGSGRPIGGAIVSLIGNPTSATPPGIPDTFIEIPPGASGPSQRQVVADGEGRFVFRGLNQGSYSMSARAPGYVFGSFGQRRPNGPSRQIALEDDQKVMDATVRLWKYAAISGRIVDETGEPAIGVSVNLVRVTTVAGRRRLMAAGAGTTDDRGMYRIGTVTPGTYLVHLRSTVATVPTPAVEAYEQAISSGSSTTELLRELLATGMSPSAGVRVGDNQVQLQNMFGRTPPPPPAAEDGRMFVYQALFYPSATQSAQATSLVIASGEERSGIDLQLKLSRAVTVSGTVAGPDGPVGNLGLRLQPGGVEDFTSDNGLEAASTLTRADGSFTFLGVPAGQYTLRAQKVPRSAAPNTGAATVIQSGTSGISMFMGSGTPAPTPTGPTLWAQTSVAVGDSDLQGLSIALANGSRVVGKIVFEGAAAQPTPERISQLGVTMSSAEGAFLSGFTSARIAADGTFTTMMYPPGRYTLSVPSPSPQWSLKSITVGGKDAFGVPLELGANDLAGVVVTFSDQPTEISGTVGAGGLASGAEAQVVAFPADVQSWIAGGMSVRRSRTTMTSTTGNYRIAGLPPGEYLVAALNPDVLVELQDLQLVNSLARTATRVTLAAGDKRTLPLTVITIR